LFWHEDCRNKDYWEGNMKLTEKEKLRKTLDKVYILIERINWIDKELRKSEIEIAHGHLRDSIHALERSLIW
jgi:hypothetical protein